MCCAIDQQSTNRLPKITGPPPPLVLQIHTRSLIVLELRIATATTPPGPSIEISFPYHCIPRACCPVVNDIVRPRFIPGVRSLNTSVSLSMESSVPDAKYVLPHNPEEQARLASQHQFIKRIIMRRNGPLPQGVEIERVSKVLDVGAGTLVWTLDVASLPEVKNRLAPLVTNGIRLYACDITDEKFPPSHDLESLGITTFVHDVTKPFPEGFKDNFDLVHMRLLCSALSEEGWRKSLKHIHDVLKPGGTLILWDCDSVWYPGIAPPTNGYSFANCRDGTSWIHKLNCVVYGHALQNRLIPDPSERFLPLLNCFSFSVKHLQRQIAPFGKLCEMAEGLHGDSLQKDIEFSVQNLGSIADAFSRELQKDGALEAPLGQKITTEEERQALIAEIMQGCQEEGTYTPTSEVVACKIICREHGIDGGS